MENRDSIGAAAAEVDSHNASHRAEPLAPPDRIGLVDALRGVALLGILLVNVAWFAQPFMTEFLTNPPPQSGIDTAAEFFVRLVAESKFYAMFSLLFGFGMAIQMSRAEARSISFVPLFFRRMFVLMLIAAAHVMLLWYGDILHAYALLGCVLLLFRNCRPRTLVIWMVVLTGAPALLLTCLAGLSMFFQKLAADQGWPAPASTATAPAAAPDSAPAANFDGESPFATEEAWNRYVDREYAREMAAFQTGTFAEQLPIRLLNFLFGGLMLVIVYPTILTMFLLGLWLAKRGILHNPAAHRDWLRPAAIFGIAIGLPLNLLYAWVVYSASDDRSGALWLVATPLTYIAGPLMCIGYVAALTLAWQTERGRRILSWPAWPGRMALSNYLLQSVICTTIFYSYGLGLFGKVGQTGLIAIALGLYLMQILISRWWLSRFRFGPMEWLWRTGTYGRWMPMRRVGA